MMAPRPSCSVDAVLSAIGGQYWQLATHIGSFWHLSEQAARERQFNALYYSPLDQFDVVGPWLYCILPAYSGCIISFFDVCSGGSELFLISFSLINLHLILCMASHWDPLIVSAGVSKWYF